MKTRAIRAAKQHITNREGLGLDSASAERLCEGISNLPEWVFYLHQLHSGIASRAEAEALALDDTSKYLQRALKSTQRSGNKQVTEQIEALLSSEEMRIRPPRGRRRKLGAFHTALAIDYALERSGMSAKNRPGVLRKCLPAAGLTAPEVSTSIKHVAEYRNRVSKESMEPKLD